MQIIVICNMAIKYILYLMQNKSEHLFMLFELSVEPHRVGDALATPRAVTRWSAVIPALPLSPCRPTDRSHYNQLAALSSGLIKDLVTEQLPACRFQAMIWDYTVSVVCRGKHALGWRHLDVVGLWVLGSKPQLCICLFLICNELQSVLKLWSWSKGH